MSSLPVNGAQGLHENLLWGRSIPWVTIYDGTMMGKYYVQVYAYKIWHKPPPWLTLPLAGRELGDLVLSSWKSLRW